MAIPKKSPHSGISSRGLETMGAAADLLGKMIPATKEKGTEESESEAVPSQKKSGKAETAEPERVTKSGAVSRKSGKNASVPSPARDEHVESMAPHSERTPSDTAKPTTGANVSKVGKGHKAVARDQHTESPPPLPEKRAAGKLKVATTETGGSQAEKGILTPPQTICSSKCTNEQIDKRTIVRKNEQMPEQMDKRANEQLLEQMDSRANGQTDNSTNGQMDKRSILPGSAPYTPISKPELKAIGLTAHQYQILHSIYFKRPFKVSGRKRICPDIPYGTVRNSLRSLSNKGWITSPRRSGTGIDMTTTCKVDERRCLTLFGPTGILNDDQGIEDELFAYGIPITKQMDNRTNGQMDNRTNEQLPGQSSSSNSSSSIFNKPTTSTEGTDSDIEVAIAAALKTPDLSFWKLKDLRVKKVAMWIRDYQVPLQDMIESLAHCAFYLRTSGEKDAKKQPIKCAASWFKSRIQKERYYDAPTGFETEANRRLRREKVRIAKQKAEIEALRKARAERERLQMDLAFEQMLADPEGELYRQCESRLNKFERQRAKKTPVAMEKALRRAFEAQMKEISDGESPE